MAKFYVNTENIHILAATMSELAASFDTGVKVPDLQKSKGSSISEMKNICKEMERCKKEFKYLAEATAKFLENSGVTYDNADIKAAYDILEDAKLK